jgi:hypothetical protein
MERGTSIHPEPPGQSAGFVEKQDCPPALLVVVPSDRELRDCRDCRNHHEGRSQRPLLSDVARTRPATGAAWRAGREGIVLTWQPAKACSRPILPVRENSAARA